MILPNHRPKPGQLSCELTGLLPANLLQDGI